MESQDLYPIKSRAQIITLIEKASLFGGDIWQATSPGEKGKHVSQIIQIQNDLKSDKVILRMPSIVQINPNMPIFVRLHYRNIIFRLFAGDFKVTGDKIIAHYPEEAMAMEERKGGDRYVLPVNSGISLSLKRIEKTMRDMTFELELRIIDVSEKGFGILISGQNSDFLKQNDHFWLKSIDHSSLRSPILGSVSYVRPKGYYLRKGDVRVGLSLANPISRETLETLKKKSFIVLSA